MNTATPSPNTIFLHPGHDPKAYYPLIKPLALMYDRIFIWNPSEYWLDRCKFPLDDFLEACTPSANHSSILQPAGRPSWFDPQKRKEWTEEYARHIDRDFIRRLNAIAQGGSTMRPFTDIAEGVAFLEEQWSDRAEYLKMRFATIASRLPEERVNALTFLTEKYKRPLEWAIAYQFVQEFLACDRLEAYAPIMDPEQLEGLAIFPGNSDLPCEPNDWQRSVLHSRQSAIPSYSEEDVLGQVKDFFDEGYDVDTMPWKRLMEIRRKHGRSIRRWLRSSLERNIRPHTLAALARHEAERQIFRGEEMISLPIKCMTSMGGIGAGGVVGAAAGIFGATAIGANADMPTTLINLVSGIAAGAGTGVAAGARAGLRAGDKASRTFIRLMALTRTYTPVVRGAVKLFGGRGRFVVDTKFFVDAAVKREAEVFRN